MSTIAATSFEVWDHLAKMLGIEDRKVKRLTLVLDFNEMPELTLVEMVELNEQNEDIQQVFQLVPYSKTPALDTEV